MNETVYLGRASFHMALDRQAVSDEAPADASTWFSHESSVILERGPHAIDRLTGGEGDAALERSALPFWRRARPSWLAVALLPVAAFALGVLVAPHVAMLRRHKAEPALARAKPSTAPAPAPLAQAPSPASAVARSVVPSSPAPVTAVAAAAPVAPVGPPTAAPPAAAPPPTSAPAVAQATAPVVAPIEPVAAAVPIEHSAPRAARPALPRQGRQARTHGAHKSKTEHAAASTPAVPTTDDEPVEAAHASTKAAPARALAKPAAVEWVDPWAN